MPIKKPIAGQRSLRLASKLLRIGQIQPEQPGQGRRVTGNQRQYGSIIRFGGCKVTRHSIETGTPQKRTNLFGIMVQDFVIVGSRLGESLGAHQATSPQGSCRHVLRSQKNGKIKPWYGLTARADIQSQERPSERRF